MIFKELLKALNKVMTELHKSKINLYNLLKNNSNLWVQITLVLFSPPGANTIALFSPPGANTTALFSPPGANTHSQILNSKYWHV